MKELEAELIEERRKFSKLKNTYSSGYAYRAGRIAGLSFAITVLKELGKTKSP